jgi:TatD DNase family protein
MELIDTHTHLESFARQGTLPAALTRAREAGVATLITIGTASDDWELYRGLAAAHIADGFIRHTVGLHPCAVAENWESEVARIEAHLGRLAAARGAGGVRAGSLSPAQGTGGGGADLRLAAGGLRSAAGNCAAAGVSGGGAFARGVSRMRGGDRCGRGGVGPGGVSLFHRGRGGDRGTHAARRLRVVHRHPDLQDRGGGAGGGARTGAGAFHAGNGCALPHADAASRQTERARLCPPHAEFAAKDVFGISYDELAAVSTATAKRFFGL